MALPPILSSSPAPTDAEFWIQAATDSVRKYCGWHVTPEHFETLVLDGSGAHVLQLPSKRVVSVDAVLVNDAPVEVEWSQAGLLTRKDGACWPTRFRSVSVNLMHGHDMAGDIQGIVAGIAQRGAMNPSGIVVSQRAGTQSATFASSGGAVGSIPLLATERAALDGYRLNWGP